MPGGRSWDRGFLRGPTRKFPLSPGVVAQLRGDSAAILGIRIALIEDVSSDWLPVHSSRLWINRRGQRECMAMHGRRSDDEPAEDVLTDEALLALASEIAHYYNNLLMGMGGCAAIALEVLPAQSAARVYLEEICAAAERGTDIERQLRLTIHEMATRHRAP